MTKRKYAPLRKITRELLEPLWVNRKIPVSKIAAHLGVSANSVHKRALALGLEPRGNAKPHKKMVDDETFSRMWAAGVNVYEMSDFCGYAKASSVSKRAAMMGLPPRKRLRGASPRNGLGAKGWGGTITMEEFQQAELGRRMAEAARSARASA
ncbi:hypothetical protein K7H20_13900 [Salipiger manganoxidans]|uniref:hypothetical protein n=1 Tax=Salipiger marinus TaxID=555512 RepID=UPI001E2A706B|nr:hypothetical protein [Salipiger manganoxidans]MCD1619159.1 hypothetical protein [Salipiger manganoxidans]